MEKKPRILYVEDDQTLAFVTKDNLELAGYDIVHKENGLEAFECFKEENFDICIVDVMMPIIDGFTLARKIRRMNEEVPILFLTAKSLDEDKIEGLKIGGDDYIIKPFSIEELKLKIEIFLKRASIKPKEELPTEYDLGAFHFNYNNLSITGHDENITMTQREADVLLMLCRNKEQVLKKSEILLKIWGDDDYFVGRSLDVFISRLRKYLRKDSSIKIENLHGIGFRLTDKVEVS
ncbi:response regulator [bacterium]|nr:response regulator [bacterium]